MTEKSDSVANEVNLDELGDEALKIDEVSQQLTQVPYLWNRRRYRVSTVTHLEASWKIFRTVAVLASIIAIFLGLFAFVTYPRIDEIEQLSGSDPAVDRIKAWSDARQAWAQQFVTLAQVVLFGSIVPLLATIAGYALAERRNSDS